MTQKQNSENEPVGKMMSAYPNNGYWKALADGEEIEVSGTPPYVVSLNIDARLTYVLSVVDCGEIVLPTGLLAICDPFAMMQISGNPTVQLPPGRYPVKVTLADVSGLRDGSHIREAYASVLLSSNREVMRRKLTLGNVSYNAVAVDAGTICFVDEGILASAMPPVEQWEDVFDDGSQSSWFSRMDDPNDIREGLANIVLPLAKNDENIILIHSGWGDGVFGVVGSYDDNNNLTAVHIDFKVVSAPEEDDDAE